MDTSKITNSYLKEFIKLKTVVHCHTIELAIKVTGYADANGLKWCIGDKYSDLFIYSHSEDTCYDLSKGQHCCISYYKEKGYTIIPAQEFIDKYEAAAQDRPEIKPSSDAEKIAALERMVADLTDQNTRYRKELDKAVEFFNQIIS